MLDFKVESIGQMCMTNLETGEKFELGEVKDLTNKFEISPYESIPINTTSEISFDCTTEFNKKLFDKIWDNAIDNNRAMEGYIDIFCARQKRRHKKKRINKKWAKRYGYEQYTKRVFAKKITITLDDYFNSVTNFEMEFDPKEAMKFYEKDVIKK